MTDLELAWLAGLLEGEGSFLFGPPSEPNSPRVALSMTDEDVVRRVAGLMDVKYMHLRQHENKPNWRPAYRVQLKGSRAVSLMRLLRPWMGERRGGRIDDILTAIQVVQAPRRLSLAEATAVLDRKGAARARDVAADFGLSIKTVEEIWRGKRWGQLQATEATPVS